MKIAPIVKEGKRIGWMFFCPACECGHAIQTAEDNGIYPGGDIWTFNGEQEKPTIRDSFLSRSHRWEPPVTPENLEQWQKEKWPQTKRDTVCHSYVTDGRIEFLNDCTHALKGQTVDLPEISKEIT